MLLVKWIAAKPENNGKKVHSLLRSIESTCPRFWFAFQILFLVPKVPLVHQQTEVLRKHTPLRVQGYYGQMGVDAWDLDVWSKEFNKHDVLVMTAQIYYNVILHAYWSIKGVSTFHRLVRLFLTLLSLDGPHNIR